MSSGRSRPARLATVVVNDAFTVFLQETLGLAPGSRESVLYRQALMDLGVSNASDLHDAVKEVDYGLPPLLEERHLTEKGFKVLHARKIISMGQGCSGEALASRGAADTAVAATTSSGTQSQMLLSSLASHVQDQDATMEATSQWVDACDGDVDSNVAGSGSSR